VTARRYDADRSMLTWVTSARHGPGLCQQPFGNLGGSSSIDVREQPAGPCGLDDPGVPPIVPERPTTADRVLLSRDLFPPGLIYTQHAHPRQRRREALLGVRDVPAVRERPGKPVVQRSSLDAGEPLRNARRRTPASASWSPWTGPVLPAATR